MAQVNIRIEDELKDKADVLFNELGINMTTAFTMFIKAALRQNGIPFDVTINTDPFYSESNMRVLKQSISDMDAGINCSAHELIEVYDD